MRLIDADKLEKLYKGWLPQLILPEDEKDKQAIETCIAVLEDAPTIDPESLRAQGEWVWKHRHHGGFRRYTGVDDFGNTHTITVDERHECDEPYCPNCGKWNESVFLNFCPNCGAKMKGGNNNE